MFLKKTIIFCLLVNTVCSSKVLDTEKKDASSSQDVENIPKMYVKESILQHQIASDILKIFLPKMSWKSGETVFDIGCGPGDVTQKRLFNEIQQNVDELIAIDKSEDMIKYASCNNETTKIQYKKMDIQDSLMTSCYSDKFDKIFSFMCFHWIINKQKALSNIYSMLKSGGEVLITFLTSNPFFQMYENLSTEYNQYVQKIMPERIPFEPKDVMEQYFKNAGFIIKDVQNHQKSIKYPNFMHFKNAMLSADILYNILPPELKDKYFPEIKSQFYLYPELVICEETGSVTYEYTTYIIHAIKV